MVAHCDPVREAVLASLRNDEKIEALVNGAEDSIQTSALPGSEPTKHAKLKKSKDKTKLRHSLKKSKKVDSNWKQLKKSLEKNRPVSKRPRRPLPSKAKPEALKKQAPEDSSKFSSFMKREVQESTDMTRVVAMDCEMVGVGPGGRQSALARVSLVNYLGDVLYDKFVKVHETVTDYRTAYSGVREEDVHPESTTAVEPFDAQKAVGEIIKGRILVGHALKNDMRVLRISHAWKDIRDTSDYYNKLWKKTKGRRSSKPPALRVIVAQVLGVDSFQKSEHDSCEDARAALMLYRRNAKEWEKDIRMAGEAARRKGKRKTPQ